MSALNKTVSQAFIALGSNLENPAHQVRQAINELTRLPATRLLVYSSLYCSAPIGRLDQPDFINAVAQIETRLTPQELLIALLEIEQRYGRIRESLNAPRILDLDILIYDDLQCREDNLTLPHPRMCQRAFVLQPLWEISPDCYIPGHGVITKLLDACSEQRLQRIQD
ncbi:MAG: 2-amino-4-hydroxy-6-hydroxymethyldihydropteridine diphosphokinase [Nitrosomonas sp.]|nr:2-amino-4-hydroxy-6-hydroxymethyldihydropteridine diphosphokinase [Nitrosomonas sp.]MDP1951715.1 2-amino-4-hydroxy-6-hydroxymethyldihydropteridine diphosphokinase [Nitrosomonas sp.]